MSCIVYNPQCGTYDEKKEVCSINGEKLIKIDRFFSLEPLVRVPFFPKYYDLNLNPITTPVVEYEECDCNCDEVQNGIFDETFDITFE